MTVTAPESEKDNDAEKITKITKTGTATTAMDGDINDDNALNKLQMI